MLRKLILSTLFATSLAVPVRAGGLDDLVQLDVLNGGVTQQGNYLGAVRLTLADGWKTYWRAPGEGGIPPSFDWGGSNNVGSVSISWPTPVIFDQNGLRSIGYADQMVLPLEITPKRAGQPVRLKGRMDFGVCKDVCIPGSLPFDATLDKDAARNPVIAAAQAQRPYSATEAGVQWVTCRLHPVDGGMQIEARIAVPASGGQEVVVIEPGQPALWADAAETSRQGDVLVAQSVIFSESGGGFALDRSRIRMTILGSDHAVDIHGCAPA